jgi:hypothetical protein
VLLRHPYVFVTIFSGAGRSFTVDENIIAAKPILNL